MKIITTHKNPDFDAIASCVAIRKLFPEAKIVFPKLPERSTKNFIIQSIIYPYIEDNEIDTDTIDTLIIVDTHSSSRIDDKFVELIDNQNILKICFDHHQEGDIICTETHISTTGANVTQIVEKLIKNNIEIEESEATLFMLGIYEDTGKLTYSSTTPRDIYIASKLLEFGADLDTIRSVLEETLSELDVLLLNDLIKNKRIYNISKKRIALTFTSVDKYVNNVSILVNKILLIDKLDAVISIFRMSSRIYVIARSNNPDIDVAEVLKCVGGGGHPQAASATVKDMTLIEVAEKLSYSIKTKLLYSIKAKDIMSFPPKFVYSDYSLMQVNDIIAKSGMNALVVLEKNSENIVGIITRQIINKASFHHMENKEIALFMNTEFKTVNINETFGNIKTAVIDENQRLVPVVSDDNRLVGVITRTNLLKILSTNSDYTDSLKQRNIKNSIEKILPSNIIDYLVTAGKIAKELNYSIYIVGGIVRDIILGYKNLDIDMVVEGNGIAFAKEFANQFQARIAIHERFKTATVIFDNDLKIDIATAREEYYDLPGSLPNVEQSSIKLDLYRRDFTINTLAVKLHDNFGDLLDFFGGLKDIKEKKIRVLHMLSFIEDPTRMFRAVRFSARLGFDIGKQTERLMKIAVELDILNEIQNIRIFNEIRQIFKSKCIKCSFDLIKKYKLFLSLNKKMIIDDRILDYLGNQERIIDECAMECKNKRIEPYIVYTILLEYLFRKSLSFVDIVGADEKTKRIVKSNTYKFPIIIRVLNNKQSTNYDVYTALNGVLFEAVLVLANLLKDNKHLDNYLKHLMFLKPLVRGKDLLELGLKPSQLFSKIIEDVFKEQLLGNINKKTEAINYIRNRYLSN